MRVQAHAAPLVPGHRGVDARRTGVNVTSLGVDIAEQSVAKARLSYLKDALKQYWDWVAAGRQIGVARGLLDLAEQRDTDLAAAVQLGQLAPVERTDNVRAILQRRSALITAQRVVEATAINLSIYYRGQDGAPMRPPAERVPSALPNPTPLTTDDEARAIETALARRPDGALQLLEPSAPRGLRLPIESHILQAWVSEAIKPLLDCVVSFGAGHFYISQSDKGGLVFGGHLDGYTSYGQRGTLPLMEEVLTEGMAMIPALSRVRVLRQWAGIMDMTPDGTPIIARTPVDGLFINGGWCYGGFKAIPGSGWCFAHTLATGTPHALNSAFTLERFREGRILDEKGVGPAWWAQ